MSPSPFRAFGAPSLSQREREEPAKPAKGEGDVSWSGMSRGLVPFRQRTVDIRRAVAFGEEGAGRAGQAVDDAAAADAFACGDRIGPAADVRIVLDRQELLRTVNAVHQPAIPRPGRDIGDRIVVAREECVVG